MIESRAVVIATLAEAFSLIAKGSTHDSLDTSTVGEANATAREILSAINDVLKEDKKP